LSLENTITPEDFTYVYSSETTLISKEEWVEYSQQVLGNVFTPVEKHLPMLELVDKLAPTGFCSSPSGLYNGQLFEVEAHKFYSEQEVLDFKNTHLQSPWVLNNIYRVEYSNDGKDNFNSKYNFILLRFAVLPTL